MDPAAMLGLAGVTAIEASVGPTPAVTARLAVAVRLPSVAVIVEEPAETPVARPAALMVATVVAELVQVTEAVRFCVEPSL